MAVIQDICKSKPIKGKTYDGMHYCIEINIILSVLAS